MSVSEVLLAPGTQWSQRAIDSFPAACALLTNGAARIVPDAAADVAMNRRRVNVCLFISDSSNLVRRGTKRRQRGHVPPSAGQESCRDTTWSCRQYHQVIKTAVLV